MSRPSASDETPYQWAIIAAGHFLIGAGLMAALPVAPWVIPLTYFILKEVRDLRKGGRIGDSLIDTTFVGIGAMGWPLVGVAGIAVGIHFHRIVRRL